MASKNDTNPAETDFSKAVMQIADANNVIKEKAEKISTLEAREAEVKGEITRYELALSEVKKETEDEARKLEMIKTSLAEHKINEKVGLDNREEELNKRESEILVREKALEESTIEIERNRAEGQKITEENAKAQAELDSKLEEAKRLSSQKKNETSELEAKRSEAEIATIRMEEQVKELEKATKEHNKSRDEAEESRKGAEALHEEVNAARQLAEKAKQEAYTENNSAEYNKGMAKQLLEVFRQSLHTYVQLNGTAIKIPELTDEHKVWIANDLLKDIPKSEKEPEVNA